MNRVRHLLPRIGHLLPPVAPASPKPPVVPMVGGRSFWDALANIPEQQEASPPIDPTETTIAPKEDEET